MSDKITRSLEYIKESIDELIGEVSEIYYPVLVFTDRKILVSGEEIILRTDGWDAITKVYHTSDPNLLLPRLVALHIAIAKGYLKVIKEE